MSLATHYLDWTITPGASTALGGPLVGGVYRYQLQGSRLSYPSDPAHLPSSGLFMATFVVAGTTAGVVPLPTVSWSRVIDPSNPGQLHYLNVGAEPGRCARDFIGEGVIIDFSAGINSIRYGQIVIFDTCLTIVGAPAHIAGRLQHAFDSARTIGQIVTHYVFRPPSSWVWVSGRGGGLPTAGATIYTGAVDVSEQTAAQGAAAG